MLSVCFKKRQGQVLIVAHWPGRMNYESPTSPLHTLTNAGVCATMAPDNASDVTLLGYSAVFLCQVLWAVPIGDSARITAGSF